MSLGSWNNVSTSFAFDEDNAIGETNYLEVWESGKGNCAPDKSSLERVFMVDWDQLDAFLDAVLGWSAYDPQPTISRTLPDQHPQIATCYAMSASWEPPKNKIDTDHIFIDPPYAKVRVNYEPVDYAVLADGDITHEWDRYITQVPTYHPEFITTAGGVQFVTNPTHKLAEQPPVGTYTTGLTLVWHQVPALGDNPFVCPNGTTMAELQGSINNATFFNYPATTVQFVGFEPHMTLPRRGATSYYWEIRLQFQIKYNGTGLDGNTAGWNHFYDISVPGWDQVVSTKSGAPLYTQADLTSIFSVTGP